MKYNDNWKHKKKEELGGSQWSDRTHIRKQKMELKKFKRQVPDIIWFESLLHVDQCDVHNSYRFKEGLWLFDNAIQFEKISFWKEMKKEHPGDLLKQRDVKIDKLLK